MNKNIDDGGPAFPRTGADGHTSPQSGMSLRDFFAVAALPVAWKAYHSMAISGDNPSLEIAETAYQLSDAMIKARKA
tara:strand:+ start:605 stop:835 length:231 start_codon:yes stop_codon:yes gene_type:complete